MPLKYYTVLLATVLILAVSAQLIAQSTLEYLALGVILILGVPHGGADHLIFKRLEVPFLGSRKMGVFILLYILLAVAFLVIWILSPLRALILFVIVSMYHFGQEQMGELKSEGLLPSLLKMFWGIYVVLTPLIWHWPETSEFILEISGIQIYSPDLNVRILVTLTLLVVTIALFKIVAKNSVEKSLNINHHILQAILLFFVFSCLPLVLGFAIYFVFWHSLGSIKNQIDFFKSLNADYSWLNYMKEVALFSILAILSIVIAWYMLGIVESQSKLSYMFLGLGMITVPHVLLFDSFYRENETVQSNNGVEGLC